jgi:hypothetical protein
MVLSRVLPPDARDCLLMRGLLRELLACCGLRNTLMYLKPYSLNKVGRGERHKPHCLWIDVWVGMGCVCAAQHFDVPQALQPEQGGGLIKWSSTSGSSTGTQ